MMKINVLLLIVFCCMGSLLSAQNKLEVTLKSFDQDPDLRYATIGFCAIDIEKNTIVAQRNYNQAMIPASSMKAITTGTSIGVLGKNYKYKTYIEYDGYVKNGVLEGNLYLKGTGDPCLGSPIMEGVPNTETLMLEFVNAIKKAGIKKINGAVVGDGSHFEYASIIPTWQWGDIGNYYGAGVSGLNLHDNMYYINFQQNKTFGATPKIHSTIPEVPGLIFQNEVTNAGRKTGDNAYIYIAPYTKNVVVRGTIPVGGTLFDVKGAIPDPELFAAFTLEKALNNSGINTTKAAATQRLLQSKNKRKVIHTHYSPTLDVIAKHTNEDSRNMYCEAMLKTIGLKMKNLGTDEDGIAAVLDFWRGRGLDMHGFFMKDGCGLSARNNVTTKVMAQILRKLYVDKNTFGDFYNLLAIAGETGTLKNVGRNSAAAGNVHAKSGSMNRIRSYTGFVTTKKGRKLSFCIIINNYSCSGWAIRKKLEQVLIAMAEMD
ncbi:MAG: D-alanyl-D-alanine carboxypeptidase/D-alanyl-D-alanine-endopeptidase [Aureispira sp.]|nr:D-alanyl-D-alanine carboxypeptidase/D-alanyl-D-alanine-endopeptidase [Aureispira sp.]